MHKIAVIGTGYVGLVGGAGLADFGNEVVCVDRIEGKIAELTAGRIPFYEPGLSEVVERNVREGRLTFTTDLGAAIRDNGVVFIAVGTPPNEDGGADASAVLKVAESIGRAMDGYRVIVNKSTVPVGMADRVGEVVAKHSKHPFDVVSNPEFLKEGAAVEDFMKPDRVIVGADSEEPATVLRELYAPFMRTSNRIVMMDVTSAELTKYAANAMLATRISFMNQIAELCEKVGADVNFVRKGIGSDPRIGKHFLFPGPGYGGSCFPKDVRALAKTADEAALSAEARGFGTHKKRTYWNPRKAETAENNIASAPAREKEIII